MGILYFYTQEIDLQIVNSIEDLPSAKPIHFIGSITQIHESEKVTFLTLDGYKQEQITALLFTKDSPYLKVGMQAVIDGRVEDYQNKKEIIIDSLETS